MGSIFGREVHFPDVLEDFADETTAHGIPLVIQKPTIPQKLIWFCLVATSFVIFCVQASNLISTFYSYHTNVELVTSESVQFPDVTICNFNKMRRTRLEKDEKWKQIIDRDDFWKVTGAGDDYGWFWDYYDSVSSSSSDSITEDSSFRFKRGISEYYSDTSYYYYSNYPDWFNAPELPENLGPDNILSITKYLIPTKEELTKFGHQAGDLIRKCSFNGRPCNHSHFDVLVNKQYGNCFTFNSSGISGGKISKVGEKLGLHLTLFIENPEYVGLLTEESGVRMAIHPRNSYPYPEDIGISLAAGFLTSIGLRQVELKRLPSPHGECTDGKGFDHVQGENYIYGVISCQKKCFLQNLNKSCGCVDDINKDFQNTAQCSHNNSKCLQSIQRRFHSNGLECHCPVPCHEFIYNTKISSAVWPSEMYQYHLHNEFNVTDDDSINVNLWKDIAVTRKNLLRVKVYFEELNYQLVEQIKTYSLATMLSSFGGLLGLFLGFSLITVFEVFVLGVKIVTIAVMKFLNKCTGNSVV
ncbi:epithelial sodium channel subunit beta-like isoform X1 [Apostichopus japonicus]|uniref:epithelial sodium channel subunit beta-like isoform X1 n=1 Tax=Stichopus japonicus TaxID=307972 RepID=UPI003AB4AF63